MSNHRRFMADLVMWRDTWRSGLLLVVFLSVFALPVRACELTYTELQAKALRVLRSEYPAKLFSPGKSSDVVTMGEVEFGLTNLLATLCGATLSPAQQDEAIKTHFGAMMKMLDERKQPAPETWEVAQKQVSLQLVSTDYLRSLKGEGVLVTRPFIPNVLVGVVLDTEDGYRYVRNEDRAAWGVSEDKLYERALANLDKRSAQTKLQGGNGEDKFLGIEEKDGYDAVRILVPWIRQEAARFLGDPFIAAVSNRDFLIMWSASTSAGFHDHALENVAADFKAQPYGLSPRPFKVWSDGRIEPLAESK